MIIKKLDQVEKSDQTIRAQNWRSRRLLLKDECMGFSLHDTLIYPGTQTPIWYKNHLEAVYCIEGEGSILDKETGQEHLIKAGTMYALDKHDQHILKAKTQMRMVCVFNPPLKGDETHDENGVYPLND